MVHSWKLREHVGSSASTARSWIRATLICANPESTQSYFFAWKLNRSCLTPKTCFKSFQYLMTPIGAWRTDESVLQSLHARNCHKVLFHWYHVSRSMYAGSCSVLCADREPSMASSASVNHEPILISTKHAVTLRLHSCVAAVRAAGNRSAR